jgi:hypothetical protein
MIYSLATRATGTDFANMMPDLKPPHRWIKQKLNHPSRIRIGLDALGVVPRICFGHTAEDHQMPVGKRVSIRQPH